MTERSFTANPGRRQGDQERGSALLVTMASLALLSSIAAFAVMQARSDFLIHRHTRDSLVAFTVAEAGLELALADLERDARFSRLLGSAGGFYPFAAPPPEYFPAAPHRFTVRVAARDADHIDLLSESSGIGRERARLVATVRRDAAPYVPAALHTTATEPSLLLGGAFRIDAGAAATETPGLGLKHSEVARALIRRLDPATAAQISGTPAIGVADASLGRALLARAASEALAQVLPEEISGDLGRGFFFAPHTLSVAAASGGGILVVEGDLRIDQTFRFDGVVVVEGDLLFAEDSDAHINGAVLQEQPGSALHLRGGGEIRYDESELRKVETQFAGTLEARATVEGWRDDS